MHLQNAGLDVDFGSLPFPVAYTDRRTGTTVRGVRPDASLAINGTSFPLAALAVKGDPSGFAVTAAGFSFALAWTLHADHVACRVSLAPGSAKVESLELGAMPLLSFPSDFRYARDIYTQKPWHAVYAPGLAYESFEDGPVHGAWPGTRDACVHACAFKDALCVFLRTSYAVAPLTVAFLPDPDRPQRSGGMELGLNRLCFDLGDRRFDAWDLSVHFIGDLNGDGKADECDYQLALKRWLPDPLPLYRDAAWYKIMCAVNGATHTTFRQALEIVRYIHGITGGAKQVAYLVGWQYDGHDTGYPSFDRLNPALGTPEDLGELIAEARDRYNCVVSVHVNVDDTYRENPGWRDDLACRDIDGTPMKWEVFLNRQAYHLCHTKDVRSGDIFRRIDDLLAVFPVRESIHVDAFRNTNSSWEEHEFIGPDKELYCGMLPIIEYFRGRGIDVTTEALNGMTIETSGVFSGLWHPPAFFPILYQHKVYGGGCGERPTLFVSGESMGMDFVHGGGDRTPILRSLAMHWLLYRYFLGRSMVEFRTGGLSHRAWARYDDGTEARADDRVGFLEVTTREGTLVADATSRFIPLGDFLYVFQTAGGFLRRTLPASWRGVPLRPRVLTESGHWLEYSTEGGCLQMMLPADTLVRFERA